MKKFTLSWMLLLASVTFVFAQVDLPALQQLNLQLQKEQQPAQTALAKWAKERGLKLRWTDKEGRIIQLMGVDEAGMPMYFITMWWPPTAPPPRGFGQGRRWAIIWQVRA